MSNRWGFVSAFVLGVVAAIAGCQQNLPDGLRASAKSGEELVGIGADNSADPTIEFPDGSCSSDAECSFSCLYPADGCDPSQDAACLGVCVDAGACIVDSTCNGGLRCVECSTVTDALSCVVICDPIPPESSDPPPEDGGDDTPNDEGPPPPKECDKDKDGGAGGDDGGQTGDDGGDDGGTQDPGGGGDEPPILEPPR